MNILFLGGDKRYLFMMEELKDRHNIFQIGFNIKCPKIISEDIYSLDLSQFDVVIFPISGINNNFEVKSEARLN